MCCYSFHCPELLDSLISPIVTLHQTWKELKRKLKLCHAVQNVHNFCNGLVFCLFCGWLFLFVCLFAGREKAAACSCYVLFYCTPPILLKTTNEVVVFMIPGPAKIMVIVFQASLGQKSPSFYSGFIKALQMSHKTRLQGVDVLLQILFLPSLKTVLILH